MAKTFTPILTLACSLPNSMLLGRRLRCTQVFYKTFLYKLLNAIGDICERTWCHKVLFYVASKFL